MFKTATLAGFAAMLMAGSAMAVDIKLGVLNDRSGIYADLSGEGSVVAARMAIEELNAKGVTIGGKKVKLELVAEDDAADPKQGTAAAQKP